MEIDNFGWNILTASALAAIGFTLWQAWGLRKQYKTIRRLRSGQSVSVLKFSSTATFFLLSGLYGYSIGSVVLPTTAFILVTMHVPILVVLKKYKGYTLNEKRFLFLFATTVPIMIVVPFKGAFYMTLAFLRMIPFAMQPIEMFIEEKVGAIDIRLFWAYAVGAFFWVTFYFAFGDLILKIISVVNTSILVATVFLYYRYRKVEKPIM